MFVDNYNTNKKYNTEQHSLTQFIIETFFAITVTIHTIQFIKSYISNDFCQNLNSALRATNCSYNVQYILNILYKVCYLYTIYNECYT